MTGALRKIAVGAACVLALGAAGIHGIALPGAKRSLEARVDRAIAAAGAEWAEYSVDGTSVSFKGDAPDTLSGKRAPFEIAERLEPQSAAAPRLKLAFDFQTPEPERLEVPPFPEPEETGEAETGGSAGDALGALIADAEAEARARTEALTRCSADVAAVLAANPVRFESGESELSATARSTLDTVAAHLAACPAYEIVLEGHADAEGGMLAKVRTSRLRADAAADYLRRRLPQSALIHTSGFGDARPIGDNETEDGRAQNRRVELVLKAAFEEAEINE